MYMRSIAFLAGVLVALLFLSSWQPSSTHIAPVRVVPRVQQFGYTLSAPIDIAASDPTSLHRVALSRAADLGRGPELHMVATDHNGGAFALNALLNLHALGYRHALVVAYERRACGALGDAAAKLSDAAAREAVGATPCAFDSWWTRHLRARKRNELDEGVGRWLIRWATLARLVRLGYNVLCTDIDAVITDDVLAHLHSRALCGRFPLMFGSESGSGGLQNGVVYACGARRAGGAAWALQEVVDRYMRVADDCGGSEEVDAIA
jgi:hypothetical protein